MAIGRHPLRDLAISRDWVDQTDGQLLESFVSRGDRSALEALVLRHAPMVWGVCGRQLDRPDAEDAFQATFLVLVRKAASIWPRERVGNWLYGVARQTAMNVRKQLARCGKREAQVAEPLAAKPADDPPESDLLALLDRELSRLPGKYRAAIVLCDLEGKTRREAARQLGLAEGTVASRLARGKAILAGRLARHGLAVSAVTLEAALATATAAVPMSVLNSAVKNASIFATGETTGVLRGEVLNLTERVVRAMFLNKLKVSGAVFAAVVIAAAGGVTFGLSAWAVDPPSAVTEKPQGEKRAPAAAKGDAELLQGEWQVIEIDTKGKKETNEDLKQMRFVFENDNLTIRAAVGKGGERKKTFKLDSTKSPKQFDMTSLDGAEEGEVAACIYKLEKDRLTLCMSYWNKEADKRPTEFKATAEDGRMVMVLERVLPPPAEKPAEKPAAGGKANGGDGKAEALLKARLKNAEEVFTMTYEGLAEVKRFGDTLIPNTTPEQPFMWSVRYLNAELAMRDKKEDRIAAYENHFKRCQKTMARVKSMVPDIIPAYNLAVAKWYLAEAELWLEKEKAK